MFNVEILYNGKKFNEHDFINDLNKKILLMTAEKIKKNLAGVTCPVHHKKPDKITFDVKSNIVNCKCCYDELKKEITKKLKS